MSTSRPTRCIHGPRLNEHCAYCEAAKRVDAEVERVAEGASVAGRPSGKLPVDSEARKNAPMARGCLDYFPLALAAVAELSRIGNEKHNPGEPIHWSRNKSDDHADCIIRHLVERGTVDTDGARHATKVAWRALALLQLELEAASRE